MRRRCQRPTIREYGRCPMEYVYTLAIVGLIIVYVGLNQLRTR